MLSQRGKQLLVVDNFKFRRTEKTLLGVKWRCTNKHCISKLLTDESGSTILGKYIFDYFTYLIPITYF